MFEHEHPLNLVDLWAEHLQREEEHEEDEEENDKFLMAKQAFKCLCFRCREEINWYHRYYYTCCQCSDYFLHKFCAAFPESLEDVCEVGHTLEIIQPYYSKELDWRWMCDVCGRLHKTSELRYSCHICRFDVDTNCVPIILRRNIIHHPSHKHPLICILKQLLAKCDACGKEHKGIFYHCPMCVRHYFVHSHCAFLPQKLQIQHTTDDVFTHIHPLTLAYSFSFTGQRSIDGPRCRVCRKRFLNPRLWIYKCEKCRYYTHLDCATSRNEPFMSIFTFPGKTINYQDDEHPDLLHLPFPDPSYSILKHLFFNENGSSTLEVTYKTHDISHQHPLFLFLEDTTTPASSSIIKPISYHDPMKRIELLCDGCLRPIMSGPIYVCANEEDEHCNFVLHEWCSRLPNELKDHPSHPQHTLLLHSKIPGMFFGVFRCILCDSWCNGFVYCCEECEYHIDVNCAFFPKEIVHNSHPNHLLSIYYNRTDNYACCMCGESGWKSNFIFSCHTCSDFHIHPTCAFLIPETTTHKCDRHPMKLRYTPAENHMSEYFCEVCEVGLNPEHPFYHCGECMQSMHPACAPSILRYETAGKYPNKFTYRFVNVKFGGTYNNNMHQHPLSFVQGIANDGICYNCGSTVDGAMTFKCLDCEFALHHDCCEYLVSLVNSYKHLVSPVKSQLRISDLLSFKLYCFLGFLFSISFFYIYKKIQ